jgi:DNA-binding transcriptional regulator YdaS (Cro superfamily)
MDVDEACGWRSDDARSLSGRGRQHIAAIVIAIVPAFFNQVGRAVVRAPASSMPA